MTSDAAGAAAIDLAVEREGVPRRGGDIEQVRRLDREDVHVVAREALGVGPIERGHAAPRAKVALETVGDHGCRPLHDRVRDHRAARREKAPRVAQRFEHVFLVREIAEHLGDDDVHARRLGHVERALGHEVQRLDAVAPRDVLREPEHRAGIVEPDFPRAELAREEREDTGARAEIGDGRLSRADDFRESAAKGRDAHLVAEHSTVEFDRHRSLPAREGRADERAQWVIAYRM